MIARVARLRYPSQLLRAEAERNRSGRVVPSIIRQPGFRATFYGRIAELEAFSITMFDSAEAAAVASAAIDAEPLLPGQTPEMLPTPESITFCEVRHAIVRDQMPVVGRLDYLTRAAGINAASADQWALEVYVPMLETIRGVSHAYLLRSGNSAEWISLVFWSSQEALGPARASIGSWRASEVAAGRASALVIVDAFTLSDAYAVIAGALSTIEDLV
ncbi:MAG: hypothetical protein ABI553_09470 [Chloroflexota bacterium]